MAQYLTPDADIIDGNWLDEGAAATDLFDGLVPGTPGSIGAGDDSTYIESPSAPSAEACAFGLSDGEDPASSSSHIMRWRRAKDAAGGSQVDLTVALHEGYVNEGEVGTVVNSFSDTDLPDAFATATDTLSSGEADSITDYTDLQIRFVADQP